MGFIVMLCMINVKTANAQLGPVKIYAQIYLQAPAE